MYEELRAIALLSMRRERPGHTLQATAVVHEAYVRLADQQGQDWKNRAHFLAVASRAMRNLLVDHARARLAHKRGAGAVCLSLDEAVLPADDRPDALLAVHEALERLAVQDPRKARVIELRFFGGLSVEETAEVLELSVPTIVNETRFAKAWLFAQLAP